MPTTSAFRKTAKWKAARIRLVKPTKAVYDVSYTLSKCESESVEEFLKNRRDAKMIELPDFSKAFDYENSFYLSCVNTRLAKALAQYELFKKVADLPGAIVECGVFKGASFIRFATFANLFGGSSRKIVGFDTFLDYPETEFEGDKKPRNYFVKEAGRQSISKNQLIEVLKRKGIAGNVELVEGDILKTVPSYVEKNPQMKISLLNLDVDIFEPSVVVLKHFWPKIIKGGVLVLDDYGVFPGETKAVDDFFIDKNIDISKFSFARTPNFIIKR